jgi:23S rRNA (guanosine2251-2'-O)-methyltransferase
MPRPPKKPFGKPSRPRSDSSDRPNRTSRPAGAGKPFGKPRFGKSEEPPQAKYRAKEGASDAPSGYGVYKREGGPPAREDRPRSDRPRTFDKSGDRPFRSDSDKPRFEKRPYDPDRKPAYRPRPAEGEGASSDRPAFKRPYDPDRKPPFKKREYGAPSDRPKRPYDPDRKPTYRPRPAAAEGEGGAEASERPAYKRPYDPDRKPPFKKREYSEASEKPVYEKPAYEKRAYAPRDGKPSFKKDGYQKKPFVKRQWTEERPTPRPDRDFPQSRHTANPENDLIHGHHAVAAAVANEKRKIVHLWCTENALARLVEENVTLPSSIETVHPRLLDHMLVGQDAVHQGIILEAEPLDQPQLNQIEKGGIVVLLDQVTDPHNVGAILRSCAAFGVSAVVSPARHTAAANGTLFKAASGAYEYVPFVKVTNLARAIDELKGYGFTVIGLDSEAETTMDQVERKRPLALVLGAEGKGVRDLTRESCDHVARLEMTGPIKSLNVSIATAVSLYALTR